MRIYSLDFWALRCYLDGHGNEFIFLYLSFLLMFFIDDDHFILATSSVITTALQLFARHLSKLKKKTFGWIDNDLQQVPVW